MKKVIGLICLMFALVSCGENKVIKDSNLADSNIGIKVEENNKIENKEQEKNIETENIIEEKIISGNVKENIEQKYKEKGIKLNYSVGMIDEMVDLNSFEIIDVNYFKDSNNVYFYGKKIEGSNPKTFELLERIYSKDNNGVYCILPMGIDIIRMKNVDVNSFEIIKENGLIYGKDSNSIYLDCEKVQGANSKTFKYYTGYAKDKDNIYLLQGFEKNKFINIYQEKELVKYHMIDKETFENIGEGYYKDKNNIYFIAQSNIWDSPGIIKGADYSTFELIDDTFAKDKNNKYKNGKVYHN